MQHFLTNSVGAVSFIFLAVGARAQDSAAFPLYAPPLTNQIVIDQCLEPLGALVRDVNNKAALVRDAMQQGAASSQLCELMMTYEESELRMIGFIEINRKVCGVLREFRQRVGTNHTNIKKMKERECTRRWQLG